MTWRMSPKHDAGAVLCCAVNPYRAGSIEPTPQKGGPRASLPDRRPRIGHNKSTRRVPPAAGRFCINKSSLHDRNALCPAAALFQEEAE